MAQHNNIGVFQLPNGNWAYRFTQTVNGKRHNHKSVKDENGEPMRSQKAAIRARQLAIMAAEARKNEQPQRRVTFAEVYQEYCDKGAGAGKPIPPSASKTAFGEITFPQSLERVSLIQLALRKSTITYQNCITQMDALTGMLRVF